MLSIHKDIKDKLDTFIQHNRIPNIIFHGENGCGKKTILKQFLHKIYKTSEEEKNLVMYVNCAFGKGIKFIRDDLKFFAQSNSHSKKEQIKSIVLYDCELLTIDAQSALRRCIELFSNNTRFFIVVNDKERLLKPIISRFCSIYIPLPIIDKKVTNLHTLKKHGYQHLQESKTLNRYIKKILSCIENDDDTNDIFSYSNQLYEKGVSYIHLEQYIDKKIPDSREKYIMLILCSKYRKSIKNDILLISQLLYLFKMRKQLTLENIYSI